MNKTLIFVIGAVTGGVIGSIVTWKIVEEKYKKIADEEIESVIETFKNRKEKEENKIEENNERINYEDKVKYLGYCPENDEIVYDDPISDEKEEYVKPYVISPEEFGEYDDYKTESLICYEDMVVTTDDDRVIEDIENVLGDALDHFGDYEDDAVHVRNENEKCDYEILKSEKLFSEIMKEEQ